MSRISNWGRYPQVDASIYPITMADEVRTILKDRHSIISRGMGRCYGDSALASHIISTQKLNTVLSFDETSGILRSQSGVSLDSILKLCVPKGWFLPVVPGTKFVSVGGAIASDIHGKNHHKEGSFCRHVLSLVLVKPSGEIISCSRSENADFFALTCGGMGLTGVIVEATIQMRRIATSYISQRTLQARNLDEIMSFFEDHEATTYSVAWIDALAGGSNLGRSLLMLGEHAEASELSARQARQPLKPHGGAKAFLPFAFPSFALNHLTVKAFNALYYGRVPSRDFRNVVHYEPFFFPLDAILHWNLMYGRRGFTQYQMVFPLAESRKGLTLLLRRVSKAGMASFLAVLKLLGDQEGPLAFPMKGFTLTLDFPISPKLFPFLDELDRIVLDHGGRLYLTKDVRMRGEFFAKTYPQAASFIARKRQLDPQNRFSSLQSERLGVTPMPSVLILGASSDIAVALAHAYAKQGKPLLLAGRNMPVLEDLAAKLRALYKISATPLLFDAIDYSSHATFVTSLPSRPSTVICVAGYLGDQKRAQSDWAEAERIMATNYTGAVSILNIFAEEFAQRGSGTIIGISSVAGERGRQSNYVYGSAKAGFTAYLSGLRNRLAKNNVHVMTVKPGFVRTKMTAGMVLPPRLTASPEQVAAAIVAAAESRVDVLYSKRIWALVMAVIRAIPEGIFKKLRL